jgi:hypothetical protein
MTNPSEIDQTNEPSTADQQVPTGDQAAGVADLCECAGCGIWSAEPCGADETPLCGLCLEHFAALAG